LTTEEKLKEAKFFLDNLKNLKDPKKKNEFYYNFSAFLSASYSVWDYVLNEANRIFGLGLPDDDTWFPHNFEEEAKKKNEQGDDRALKFYKWFSSRKKAEESSPVGKAFGKARIVNIHKKPVFEIRWEPIKIEQGPPEKTEKGYHSQMKLTLIVYLVIPGIENLDLLKASDTYYSVMENFVSDARKKIEELGYKKP